MDLLDNFENDQKILGELKELLDFAPPAELRRELTDLFFHCFAESADFGLPNQQELIKHFYYLLNFLSEVEEVLGRK